MSNKIIFTLFLIISLFLSTNVFAVTKDTFPKRASYFLEWEITPAQAELLAKHDLIVLDMETQVRSLAQLKRIREINPEITMLVYITPEDINTGAATNPHSALRRELGGQIPDSWYLKNSAGNKISWWPGTELLNVTDKAPLINNQRYNQMLVNFVVNRLLSTGLWDGVFYDNMWDNITYFVGNDVDLNLDRQADSDSDAQWKAGMKFIYNETRRLTNNQYLILGNGTTREYNNDLNGKLIENFLPVSWGPTMKTYAYNFAGTISPRINIVNANMSNDRSAINYQKMRFGLGSTLMEDGFYSFDEGDKNHNLIWWYDEFNINLGGAISKAKSLKNYSAYEPDVWRRDFSNGLALVNSTGDKQTVDLGGEYEKIKGTQDPKVNDGSIVNSVTLNGYDGLLLLKTFSSVNNVLFRNGDFLRFFDSVGNRLRNGFFVFEPLYKGGDKIAHLDLDGNGLKDLLIVSGNKLMAWRDDGQLYMKIYPYTVDYQGELRVALGDLNKDGFVEVYVAPSVGYPLPIKIYTRHGRQMKQDWFPFGEKYFGGYSLAVGDLNNGTNSGKDLLIGKTSGEPKISIFDYKYNLTISWLAFNNRFGVNLASGNVDGLPGDEVVTGAGVGSAPYVRVFNKEGKLLNEFLAYSSLSNPGIEVLTADINADGAEDIVSMSSGF